MGAEKESLTKKCGEILINVKKNKKSKVKVYIFNCAFCNENCDQLKKFSLHLDEKHFAEFSVKEDVDVKEEEPTIIDETTNVNNLEAFVPEIKVEELMEIGINDATGDEKKHMGSTKTEDVSKDPLETHAAKRASNKTREYMEVDVKHEKDMNEDSDEGADEAYDFNYVEFDYEDSVDGCSGSESDNSDSKKPVGATQRVRKTTERKCKPKKLQETTSDAASSDNAADSDFDIDEGHTSKTINPHKIVKNQKLNVNEKELTIAILQALEKQPILWNVKSRSHNKVIRQHGFEQIAKEVNETLKIKVKWEDIRRRIKDMRTEYSYEFDKQLKGEICEMPWYSEHMKFLKENIEALIKHRFKKKKYKRLKTLDDAHVPIFIEYYKNCEILWQVNNIGFVVKTRKTEALKQIIQELKVKHNIDINILDIQRRFDYLNRLYSANREQELRCELENKEFMPSSKYYKELSFLSESQGPFKCSHCNEIIHKYEKYHIHVAEHTNIVPFKCALCEVRFKKLPKYIVHAKRHLGINKYHCDVCGKGYQFRSELEWHVREHTGEEPYLCEICGASFRSQNSYDNHIRRHEKRFRYECHICKHGFNHPYKLKTHVKAHLNIRDILCNVCGKGFTAMNHLRRHQQIHSETKRYKCIVCGKAFAQDAGLRAHRKQHPEYAEVLAKTKFRKRKYNYE